MQKSRKIKPLALILAVLMLASSCSSGGTNTENNNESGNNTEVTDAGEGIEGGDYDEVDFTTMSFVEKIKYATSQISDDLPDKKYDGADFVIRGTNKTKEFTGEVVNDAKYQQDLNVEERFNIKIVYEGFEWGDFGQYVSGVKSLFLAGDDVADLMQNWNTATSSFASEGFFVDLTQFSCIDTTKPWFFGDEMSLYSYKGHEFVATGTMDAVSVLNAFHAVAFNKELQNQYNIENLYDVVREGRWTVDYVKKTFGDLYTDVNGNGEKDEDDYYGMNYAPAGSWMCAAPIWGIPQIGKDEKGELYLSTLANPERAQVVQDNIKELLDMPGIRFNNDWDTITFMNGHSIICATSVSVLNGLRDGTFEYGLLPLFKADELQEEYYSSYLPNPWAIPITADDKEMCAVILTAIAAEGYKQVLPVFYETAIKSKFATDEDTGEMLDIMLAHVKGDGMFMYGDSAYIYNLWNYFKATQGFGSYYKSKDKVNQKNMENIIKKFEAVTGE